MNARLVASLQIAIHDWIEKEIPDVGEKLRSVIEMPSGNDMSIDQVSMYMALAAHAVLSQASASGGLGVD